MIGGPGHLKNREANALWQGYPGYAEVGRGIGGMTCMETPAIQLGAVLGEGLSTFLPGSTPIAWEFHLSRCCSNT
jgi:hypothetical protein